jgi:hypothetical protein
MKKIVNFILRPQWVAFTTPDDPTPKLGLKIWGMVFGLYKADVLCYSKADLAYVRRPHKREFGESLTAVS